MTLQNVFERFSRLALVGTNAVGARIVANGCFDNGMEQKRMNLTSEQMEREIKARRGSLIASCSHLQCYIRPFRAKDHTFRGVYMNRVVSSSNEAIKKDIIVHYVEDPLMLTHNDRYQKKKEDMDTKGAVASKIQNDIEVVMMEILDRIERMHKNAYTSDHGDDLICKFSADFFLDEHENLWLVNVGNVLLMYDETAKFEVDTSFDEHSFLPQVQGVSFLKQQNDFCADDKKGEHLCVYHCLILVLVRTQAFGRFSPSDWN